MPRQIHHMTPSRPLSETRTTEGSGKGAIGEAMQTFGKLMYQSQMQQSQQDAAFEMALLGTNWVKYSTGGDRAQPTMQRQGIPGGAGGQRQVQPQQQRPQLIMVPRDRLTGGATSLNGQQQRPGMGPRSMLMGGQARQGAQQAVATPQGQAGLGQNFVTGPGGQRFEIRNIRGKSYIRPVQSTFREKADYSAEIAAGVADTKRDQEIGDAKTKRTQELIDSIRDKLYKDDAAIESSIRSEESQKDVITHRQGFIDKRTTEQKDYEYGLKKPGFREYEAKGKAPTTGQALDKVAQLEKAKATFNKTGKIDLIASKLFPELAGEKISPEDKAKVSDAFDKAINYYEKFTPTGAKKQRAISELKRQNKPITDANIEYVIGLF